MKKPTRFVARLDFNLFELLVVTGLIAVRVAMLLPSLNAARQMEIRTLS